MTSNSASIRAARTLRDKALRLHANAHGKPYADEAIRQATALEAIADHVEQGVEALRLALGPVETPADGITTADRERAGQELYGLAQRRAEKGTQRQLDAPTQEGWERGASELPIHRATLSEAAQLYELALALHYDSYWDYSRGLLHESLGEFEKAIQILDNLRGHYSKYGPEQAARCRRKLAGTYDMQSELNTALNERLRVLGKNQRAGREMKKVFGLLGSVLKRASSQPTAPPPATKDSAPLEDGELERAESTARDFAEHLANGNFDAAHALLAVSLQRETSIETLRETYLQMMGAGELDDTGAASADADSAETSVMVMNAAADMPNLESGDLGWVYVSIHRDWCNEAVTVVVTDENGNARIRELEWGRP